MENVMKKSIISLVTAVCLLFSAFAFVSCEESPEAVAASAITRTAALDSYSAVMEMSAFYSIGEEPVAVPMTVVMKVEDGRSEAPKISADASMSLFGKKLFEVSTYSDGEWMYLSMGELGGYKTAIENADDYNYTANLFSIMKEIPANAFESIEMEKDEKGNSVITIDISDGAFAGLYGDLITSVNSGTGADVSSVTVADPELKITVEKGYIKVYDLEFDMNVTVNGEAISTKIVAKITYSDPGKAVTVDPPEGYESFKLVDSLD